MLPTAKSQSAALPRMAILSLALVLGLLTLPWLIYVIVRVGDARPIQYNEGWNTWHTARLVAGEPLYTPIDRLPLIPVNYPPTSFLITGVVARLIGSVLLSGRLLSLLAMLAIGGLIYAIVYRQTAQRLAAGMGALLWLALLVHTAPEWAASHEPQLLGYSFSVVALYLYQRWAPMARDAVAAPADGETPPLPARVLRYKQIVVLALLCVFALSIKHILIAAPLTHALLLLVTNRRAFGVLALTGMGGGALLALACWLYGGANFMSNFLDVSRPGSPARILEEMFNLLVRDGVGVILLPLVVVPWRVARWRWALVYLGVSLLLAVYWSQGIGVSRNGWFDVYGGAAIGWGLLVASLPTLNGWRRGLAYMSLALLVWPVALNAWSSLPDLLDTAGRQQEERVYLEDVALLRSIDGPALYEDLQMGYDAGKALLVDPFLAAQLMVAGRVSEEVLLKPIRDHTFSVIVLNSDLRRRLNQLDGDAPTTTPQTTAHERWTDNTLRAIRDHYAPLDTGRRLHYFYVAK